MYRLKNNAADFVVVDGRFAGRSYKAGELYAEIPPEEKGKFEQAGDRLEDPQSSRAAEQAGDRIEQQGSSAAAQQGTDIKPVKEGGKK